MKTCIECLEEKDLSLYYFRSGRPQSRCKVCHNRYTGDLVTKRRRSIKKILVDEHGGQCLDCGYVGPAFMYDFDHRDPDKKSFEVNSGRSWSIERLREEARKCDLVCANCHRMRTHKQRCDGCEYCSECSQGDKAASS